MKKYLVAALVMAAMVPSGAAYAHNAAHIILPNGNCVSLGAGNSVVLPEQAQAPTNAAGELDLDPTANGDQFGARFAASFEQTPMERQHCAPQ